MIKKYIFDIDVVAACNLRCPSCPQGNSREYRPSSGFMEPELLAKIIAKATSECSIERISLFCWGEPLLHPRLPELVRVVEDAGITCYLSSNLNILPGADALMAANPSVFRISVSGFSQGMYACTHRGGDIERVKQHMVQLAEARKRTGATTRIYVYYHRYRHNLKEEPLMREFAASLGFGFEPTWALLFPVEKIICCAEDETLLTDQDRDLINYLALPPAKAFEVSPKDASQFCVLRENAINLDPQGNVQLCCGVFDAKRFSLGRYLDMPLEKIQQLRRDHVMCQRCMQTGAHFYLAYRTPAMEELFMANISPEDSKLLGLRREHSIKSLKQRLANIYRKYLCGIIPCEMALKIETCFNRLLLKK